MRLKSAGPERDVWVRIPPRALSIWDALLGPSRRGEIIGSREPERHIWMGQDQRDLDIPVLLEVPHFLDQTAKNPPEGIENSGSRADTKFP
jgi:hypothetical protein